MNDVDPRFDTSKWKSVDRQNISDDASVGSNEEEEDRESLGEDSEDAQDGEPNTGPLCSDEHSKIVKPLSEKELASFEKRQNKRGIIYISRIPRGMTVAKVRHLLGAFGEIERLYLQDGREKETGQKLSGKQGKSAHFTEGWVEFSDKRVAKTVAEMLNAEPIGAVSGGSGGGKGGKKAGGKNFRRWKDEVWTMKYLSGFKWYMLSEQLANERASRASRVRAELSQSAQEQKDYLRKVERARVQREKEARQKARQAKSNVMHPHPEEKPKTKSFKQRQAVVTDVREMDQRYREDTDRPSKRPRTEPADGKRAQALQGALSKIF